MQPKEVLDSLQKLGVKISRKTLYNFEQYKIIPPAEQIDSRTAQYPFDTFAEIFAAEGLKELYRGKMKLTKDMIREIRELAIQAEEAKNPSELLQGVMTIEKDLAYKYLMLKTYAKQEHFQKEGLDLNKIIDLIKNKKREDDKLTQQFAKKFSS